MAASLLCTDREGLTPCGRCSGCLQLASGNHPDFIHIFPEGASIKIARIRSLKKQLAFPPFSGGMRVVLLEEVQSMRREAGNSLLKLLEEPPPDNIFFLIASDAEPVLSTILSRCQTVNYGSLADNLTVDIIGQLSPDLDRNQALTLARISGGAPGKALALEAGGALALFERIVGALVDRQVDEPVMIEDALLLAADMAALKGEVELLFDLLKMLFRDVLVLSLGGKQSIGSTDTGIKELERIRERWNLSQLSDKMNAVEYAEKALVRNCNRGLICDVLMLQLLAAAGPLKTIV